MLSFFPPDVLDEIWDVIESVSEGFLTYSFSYINVGPVLGKQIQMSFDMKNSMSIWSLLHKWSFYMKFTKQVFGEFHKFHIK